MDSFIFIGDYAKQIQSDNLSQIIGGNQTILDGIQRAAVEECVSYLKQKFDVSKAFQHITQHDNAKAYKAGQTVYLNAAVYDPTKTYALDAQVLQAGSIYKCTTAIVAAEAFTPGHWGLVGTQYAIYFAAYPKYIFDYEENYKVGSQVFWKDKVYTCRVASSIMDHQSLLQSNRAGSDIVTNSFPDQSVQQWGAGDIYEIVVNTEISDAKWTLGDNRDQKLLQICIDIALYHAHSRISPKNIPDLRAIRYIGDPGDRVLVYNSPIKYPAYSALGWLQCAAKGELTPELPMIQPKQGRRIRFGGNQKIQNQY
jgi:hypothetical protein